MKMKNAPLPRLDGDDTVRHRLLPFCRLRPGDVWDDPQGRHRVACIDATLPNAVATVLRGEKAQLAIQDPPYNVAALERRALKDYLDWCRGWLSTTDAALAPHSSLYVWMGADQNDGFQPLPDFMILMRDTSFRPRSFITMRNQRGYGTQKNWMAVRQELLYYIKGNAPFFVEAEYTDIPKILRGYYKQIGDRVTENTERGKAPTIRAGNVWVDVQQVFYRMEENVSGCYAQKPLKAIERIIRASSARNDLLLDFFSHSGTTLLAAEIQERRCFAAEVDPIYAEISIRRLEHFRRTGERGWQNGNAFEQELADEFSRPRNRSNVNLTLPLFSAEE